MSRYTYVGNYQNPTDEYNVEANPDGEGFIITVNTYCECGSECCSRPKTGTRPHTSGVVFADEDEAYEYIEHLSETFEQDYDDYLEENRYSLMQMERYEMWRNEYLGKRLLRLRQTARFYSMWSKDTPQRFYYHTNGVEHIADVHKGSWFTAHHHPSYIIVARMIGNPEFLSQAGDPIAVRKAIAGAARDLRRNSRRKAA